MPTNTAVLPITLPNERRAHVRLSVADLPKKYEDFAKHPEWAGHVAIDGTDNEWLKAMFDFYGEDKATKIIEDIVATVKPVVTDGHLASGYGRLASDERTLGLRDVATAAETARLEGHTSWVNALCVLDLVA